jgi:hypothetical protein
MKMTSVTMTHLLRPQRSLCDVRPKDSGSISLDGRACGLRRFATVDFSQTYGKCGRIVEVPLILERTEEATDDVRCERA